MGQGLVLVLNEKVLADAVGDMWDVQRTFSLWNWLRLLRMSARTRVREYAKCVLSV
jgi:hypothetical protein